MYLKAIRNLLMLSVIIAVISCNDQEVSQKNEGDATGSVPPKGMTAQPGENPEYLETLLTKDSLNTDAHLKLAAIYYAGGNTQMAFKHYLFVIRHDENNGTAILNLGNLNYDIQNNREAISWYEKYLKLDNNNVNVRCDLATCYLNIDSLAKATRILRENIRINPSHPQSHYNLSVILSKSGNMQEAASEMKIFNSLNSGQQK